MKKKFFYLGLLFLIFSSVACFDLGSSTSPKKVTQNPNSGFDESNKKEIKKKIEMLDKKIANIDRQIESQYRVLNQIDMDMNSVLGMNSNPFGKNIGGDVRSVYTPPHLDIKNLSTDRVFVIDKINDLEKKRKMLINEKASLQNESINACFSKNTFIKTAEGTSKMISNIRKGDKVLVYDFMNDSYKVSKVEKIFINSNNHFYIINDNLKITAFERFLTDRGWKRVLELKIGDKIYNGRTYVEIKSIKKVRGDFTVYNLKIKDTHNFFVSADGDNFYIVHNCGGGGGK
jgi:hypothetical protein